MDPRVRVNKLQAYLITLINRDEGNDVQMQFINPGWNVFHVLNTETFFFSRIFILVTSRYIETLIFLVQYGIYIHL